jgi:hypothetical protein
VPVINPAKTFFYINFLIVFCVNLIITHQSSTHPSPSCTVTAVDLNIKYVYKSCNPVGFVALKTHAAGETKALQEVEG